MDDARDLANAQHHGGERPDRSDAGARSSQSSDGGAIGGDLLDGLAINVLSHSGCLNFEEDPYYSPLKDERILRAVTEWKNGRQDALELPFNRCSPV